MKMTLRAIRANFGLDQKQAAEYLGVSENTWSNYENNKSQPGLKNISKIQRAFHISYNDIIFCDKLRLNSKIKN